MTINIYNSTVTIQHNGKVCPTVKRSININEPDKLKSLQKKLVDELTNALAGTKPQL